MCRRPAEERWPMIGLPTLKKSCRVLYSARPTPTTGRFVIPPMIGPLSMAKWDSNSQINDDPYAVSLDNGQIHYANWVKTLSPFYDTKDKIEDLLFKTPGVPMGTKWRLKGYWPWTVRWVAVDTWVFFVQALWVLPQCQTPRTSRVVC